MIVESLVRLIAPPSCLGCGIEGKIICDACLAQAPLSKAPTCYRCNKLSDSWRTCRSCRSSTALSGAVVASYYDGIVKDAIHVFKYNHQRSVASSLAKLL